MMANLAVSPILLETRDFQTGDPGARAASCSSSAPTCSTWPACMDMVVHYIIEHHGERIAPGDMWLCNDPLDRHRPPARRQPALPGLHRRRAVLLGRQHRPPERRRRHPPRLVLPERRGHLLRPAVLPAVPDRQGRQDRPRDRGALPPLLAHPGEPLARPAGHVAGNHAARARIARLVEKYGKEMVKGVMRGVLDASQSRLRSGARCTIPDGTYSERLIQEVAVHRRPRHLPGADPRAQAAANG